MEKIQKFHPGRFYTSPSDKNWYELVERGALTLTFRVRKAKARCGSWILTVPASFKADEKGAFETVRFCDGTILRADSRTLPVTPAAGHRYVAEALRERGTTVYFEPARVETNADLESVRRSDIVKFSNENIPDASFADGFRDKLFVQTLGKEGLRYKFLEGDWNTLPPVVNAHVVDTEGAGDATTSAIIFGIARSGKRFRDLDETELVRILTEAQRFASESVSRMGTKAITT